MSTSNPYYSPADHGLTVVGEACDPTAEYSFDIMVVWTDGRRLYYATDSGCSCPEPFEYLATNDSLWLLESALTSGLQTEALAAVDNWAGPNVTNSAWIETISRLKQHIRAWNPRRGTTPHSPLASST